jgi:hypothetical protein
LDAEPDQCQKGAANLAIFRELNRSSLRPDDKRIPENIKLKTSQPSFFLLRGA